MGSQSAAGPIRVAIVGVGNCAASLVQGVHFYRDADPASKVPGLMETFQASLALALALSSQLQGLAARGAARLESIFLDEGFGTLDETNLDLVASALENLAARGDRMVGVVTHVPALAERVPVRFAVDRDRRTSSVVREGP